MSEQAETYKCIVAIKVRGTISAHKDTRDTLTMLRLDNTNHAVIIDNRPAFKGMLQQIHSYVTWGEPNKDTIALLLKKRGKLKGGKKITDDYAKKIGYKSVDDLADAISNCKVDYWKLEDIQPLFRLHPPSKGYKGKVKRAFQAGGEAGYRGEAINDLILRMI
jgi:large subunit ribosomal protein L30